MSVSVTPVTKGESNLLCQKVISEFLRANTLATISLYSSLVILRFSISKVEESKSFFRAASNTLEKAVA